MTVAFRIVFLIHNILYSNYRILPAGCSSMVGFLNRLQTIG